MFGSGKASGSGSGSVYGGAVGGRDGASFWYSTEFEEYMVFVREREREREMSEVNEEVWI